MAAPVKKSRFDEAFLRRLEYLFLVSRRVFSGRMRAERRSRKRGSGIEFADHRDYSAGDDLRYIDWSVYGRLDRLLLRLFEEEEDLHIYLLCDCSASMAAPEKFDYLVKLAAALAYVGLAKLDRVSVVPFGGGAAGRTRLPASRGKGNIFKVLDYLDHLTPSGPTDLLRSVESFVHATRRPGLVIVLSDFFADEGYTEALNLLRYHRHEPTVLQIIDPRDQEPPLLGDVELYDVESDTRRDVTLTESAVRAYREAFAQYCDDLQTFSHGRGMLYFRASIDVPFDELVLQLLRRGGLVA